MLEVSKKLGVAEFLLLLESMGPIFKARISVQIKIPSLLLGIDDNKEAYRQGT